jgi:hypothetical protein
MTFQVGPNRTYAVVGAPTSTGAKSPVGSFFTGSIGQYNSFVHTNGANNEQYFYSVSSISPEGLTVGESPVEYAMYRQPRGPTNRWHWVAAPVAYGSTSNRLDSTLGEQMARGMKGGLNAALADQMYILQSSGSFTNVWLDSVSGKWKTMAGADATNALPEGVGVLLKRINAPPANTNALYAGAVRTNTSFTIPIATGWNLVAWPHNTTGPLWNFSGAQPGATVALSDEIWLNTSNPQRNRLRLGADSIWRTVPGNEIATNVITLKPTDSFYFRHKGGGFSWVPAKP